MVDFEGFEEYIQRNGEWEMYRPILCQFVVGIDEVPEDAYGAEQVQDVFPHGETYMPDTGMIAKEDPMPDPVWSSRKEFESYVEDIVEYDILEADIADFDEDSIQDEIVSIQLNDSLEGRDLYSMISKIDSTLQN
ncbi:MAG: hypothetical protein BRC27_02740 [Nanohaloarchaea archaeon SW_10_44_10]|nr:MAG: hypothetical protein BRC27_02740 [Nanohaloarchaea archaeon SW_10_44_10]